MIAKLEGTVWDANGKFLVVGVGGIGFKVSVTAETRETTIKGSPISLFTYLAVREDALDLYGFLTEEEKEFFEMIISISGIGPKTALGVLSTSSVIHLKRSIASGDMSQLVKVSGIGKKIAEKMMLELKDKIVVEASDENFHEEMDALEALKALGYNERDARDALKEVSKDIVRTEDRIREALKIVGR